jgi:hypothetical protein
MSDAVTTTRRVDVPTTFDDILSGMSELTPDDRLLVMIKIAETYCEHCGRRKDEPVCSAALHALKASP